MTKPGSVLIVDDDEDILIAARLLLKREYTLIETCSDPADIPTLMANQQYDVILLDMNFSPGESSGEQGYHWLQQILQIDPQAVVVLITAHGGVDVAVEAMKLGATDFVSKPWQNEKLLATISASMQLKQSRTEISALKQTNTELASARHSNEPMLGTSVAMRTIQSLISRSAPTEANVLILGENGTGKELAAQALHQQSSRADQVFMSVDLGSVTESLFESELFGHKKGAFTDARSDRIGRLQAANGGTIFLDEIGNLPLHLQAKLLTVLESRKVTPVGSDEASPIDIRVIAATNLSGEKLQDESYFRQDLRFRLNTVEIRLPPLRERKQDIAEIAKRYAAIYTRKYMKEPRAFSPGTLEALCDYSWPGNVRALKHAIERAVILADGPFFETADFAIDLKISPVTDTPDEDDLNLDRIEKRTIEQALRRHGYNISHSAKELGLTRAALYRRMEKHGL